MIKIKQDNYLLNYIKDEEWCSKPWKTYMINNIFGRYKKII